MPSIAPCMKVLLPDAMRITWNWQTKVSQVPSGFKLHGALVESADTAGRSRLSTGVVTSFERDYWKLSVIAIELTVGLDFRSRCVFQIGMATIRCASANNSILSIYQRCAKGEKATNKLGRFRVLHATPRYYYLHWITYLTDAPSVSRKSSTEKLTAWKKRMVVSTIVSLN